MSENADIELKMALFIVPETGSEKIYTFEHTSEKSLTILGLHKTRTKNVDGDMATDVVYALAVKPDPSCLNISGAAGKKFFFLQIKADSSPILLKAYNRETDFGTCSSLGPVGMYSKNDMLVALLIETEKINHSYIKSQVILRYKSKNLQQLRFNAEDNWSFGINKKGKGDGRIVLSALVPDFSRLLGFGIDVQKKNGKTKN